MSIVNATDATFDAEVLGGNDVVLVDFWAVGAVLAEP